MNKQDNSQVLTLNSQDESSFVPVSSNGYSKLVVSPFITQPTPQQTKQAEAPTLPINFVPTPTIQYRRNRKIIKVSVEPGLPTPRMPQTESVTTTTTAVPTPLPVPGTRVLMWKQDPSVAEIGIRKAFLPTRTNAGPQDARIKIQGLPIVTPNAFGDLIQTPGTDAFDAVHTYAVVRQTLTMYQRARGGVALPWQWNSASNTEPLSVFPRGLPDTMNAYYSRSAKSLKFGDFVAPGSPPTSPRILTCRSLDIVSHETGHAILDGLKPGWLNIGNPPQTGGLHESFGDLTAIFLTLSQLDQVEAIIAQTKADLHDKNFLSDLAEQFGLALGRPNGLRNADNDLKLSQVGTEVHAISQVMTGAIYDILADIFAFERRSALKDDAALLYEVGQYVFSLYVRAIVAAPSTAATFVHIANNMLTITAADGKPVQYRNFIRNRFTVREVVVSPVLLNKDHQEGLKLEARYPDQQNAVQDRRGCCGTMNHWDYNEGQPDQDAELAALLKIFKTK